MKNVFIRFGIVMVFFAAIFIACEQDSIDIGDDSMTVDEAKSWFDANQPEFLVLKSGGMSKNTKVIKPSWKGAYASKNRKVEVVETHIMTNGAFGFATEDTYKEWLATDNSSYLTSLSRIVVMRYKDTEEIVSFIMTIVGDKEYLEKKDFKLWDNDYTVKDDDFSGLVLYHSLEGKFVNGWRYTNGELTHKVRLDTDLDVNIGLKSYECTTYSIYEMFVECTYLGITGEYGLLYCSDDISYEYVTSVVECVWVDDDDDDDSGAGGYSPDQGNNPYTPQSGDKFCKSGLSNTMEKQIVNTCVTAIMEYINNEFCGGNTNEGVYHADYFQTYGTFVHQHGVSSDNIIPFVSKHFNVTGFMGFTDAIVIGK